jgi:hypothetical protein
MSKKTTNILTHFSKRDVIIDNAIGGMGMGATVEPMISGMECFSTAMKGLQDMFI